AGAGGGARGAGARPRMDRRCRRPPPPPPRRETELPPARFFGLTAGAVALIAGCAVGPGYHRPALGLPEGWRAPPSSEDALRPFCDPVRPSRDTLLPPGADTARVPFSYDTTGRGPGGRSDSAAALRWVDLFEDPVLRQLVDTALKQNRDVQTAIAVIDEFRARYRATRGGLLPELTAHGQAGGDAPVFGHIGVQTFNVYQAPVNGRWELDFWGRLRRATQAARADLLAEEENRRTVELSLIGTAAVAYGDLPRA